MVKLNKTYSINVNRTKVLLLLGFLSRWSAIASRLPGRTDNEIKNYWNTHIRKRLLRMGIDPVTHSPRLDLLDLSSILGSSLCGSSQINIQRLLGMHPMVNPELLKLASSLFSSQQREHLDFSTQNGHHNQLCDPQIQNQNPHFVQFQDPVRQVPDCTATALTTPCVSLPLTQAQLVEPSVNTYPSNLTDRSYQQHSQLSDNWHTNEFALSTLTEDYIPQLSSYDYYSSDYHQNLMDPSLSEASTFHSNNSNQNFSFASVMSTRSSSPTTLNSSSTYINGSSTEDERESYGSSNILKFEIPDVLDVSEFI